MPELSAAGSTLPAALMLLPNVACALAYAALTVLILVQARRSRTGFLLAAAAGITAAWATAALVTGAPLQGVANALDLLRAVAWYGFCLHLYRRATATGRTLFTMLGLLALLGVFATLATGAAAASGTVSLFSPALALRLALAICQLLLLENLYRGTVPDQRWFVGLACIALGGLAAFDVVMCADAVLLHAASPTLVAGRPLVAALVAPLLAVAAARNRTWRVDIHVSRAAALHTATLVVSGVFLLALAAAGEVARNFAAPFGAGWGSLAEIALVFAGVIAVAVLLTSGSARGVVRGLLLDHFFTHRFDYRREWQRCIDALSAVGSGPLPQRVIKALADAVDSPQGLLFTRGPGRAGFAWAAAWNTLPARALPEGCGMASAILAAEAPLVLAPVLDAATVADLFDPSFDPWLAIPLPDPAPGSGLLGCILLAQPRAAFRLDAEVLDLLRILAHEVAIHLAQERAAAVLLQTRELRAYGERFAFVAHDIKNVSSQLSLLLSNAETHLADPEFQRDMLATVRASVARIGGLIRRLEPARERPAAPARLDPAPLLAALVAARQPLGGARLTLAPAPPAGPSYGDPSCGGGAAVVMEEAALQAAVTHVLDNAIAAAGAAGAVEVALRAVDGRVLIDVADDGPGMTPEFIRDELFTPFATRTEGGSGLGAFQARELLRAAGGDLIALSRPGQGTTMRLSLPLAAGPGGAHNPDRRDEDVTSRNDDDKVMVGADAAVRPAWFRVVHR